MLFVSSLHCGNKEIIKAPMPVSNRMQVVKHMLRVTITHRVLVVPIASLNEKCMRIDVDPTRVYVCHVPNSFEKD